MSAQIYIVKGMSCSGCVSSVTKALKLADPNAEVSVELEGGKVTLESGLSDDAIRLAIEDAGFDFEGRGA
jgi:copper chaperone CopZ